MDLHDLRREYLMGELRRADLCEDPHDQFAKWMQQAFDMEVVDPPAMTIATVDASGMPSQRIVLLKHFDASGFVFYTSYASHKDSLPKRNTSNGAGTIQVVFEGQGQWQINGHAVAQHVGDAAGNLRAVADAALSARQ